MIVIADDSVVNCETYKPC